MAQKRRRSVPFGQQLDKYRSALGWTFIDLAQRTGINSGTLHRAETTGSLSESNRRRVVQVITAACKDAGIPCDSSEFYKLAGLTGSADLVQPTTPPAKRNSNAATLLKYQHFHLDLVNKLVAEWQRDLYRGRGQEVLEKTSKLFHELKDANFASDDQTATRAQIYVGLLKGQAQEAVLPWYQRCVHAIKTYDEIEKRLIHSFPLHRFSSEYAKLFTLRAELHRELGKYEKSLREFEDGISSAIDAGDDFLHAALLRNRAHVSAVQGNQQQWEKELQEAEGKTRKSQFSQSGFHAVRASGFRRLAYNPWIKQPLSQREAFAIQAIEEFAKAHTSSLDAWQSAPSVIVDDHPLVIAVLQAQCFVWIDPTESLRLVENLRPKAARLLPSLLVKLDFTEECAKKLYARKKNDPLPMFNLDERYHSRPTTCK